MSVVLILVDGMRPDSFQDLEKAREIAKRGASTMTATTVMPSITLPCHMSLFHSVDPSRHGTTTNVYAPQVRPINGLFDVLPGVKSGPMAIMGMIISSGISCPWVRSWPPWSAVMITVQFWGKLLRILSISSQAVFTADRYSGLIQP